MLVQIGVDDIAKRCKFILVVDYLKYRDEYLEHQRLYVVFVFLYQIRCYNGLRVFCVQIENDIDELFE
jgi:hypothetical protein